MDDVVSGKILWVREIRRGGRGQQLILCVSDNYQDVRVGDVFTKRYEVPNQTADDVLRGGTCLSATGYMDVELTVTAIEWPRGVARNSLPNGHTGAVQFAGAGSDDIVDGTYLAT